MIRVSLDERGKALLKKLAPASAIAVLEEGMEDLTAVAIRSWADTVKVMDLRWKTSSRTLLGKAGKQSVELQVGNAHVGFAITGTRPHKITARNGRALNIPLGSAYSKPSAFMLWARQQKGTGPLRKGSARISAFGPKQVLKSGKPGALHESNFIQFRAVNHPGFRGYKTLPEIAFVNGVNQWIPIFKLKVAQALNGV